MKCQACNNAEYRTYKSGLVVCWECANKIQDWHDESSVDQILGSYDEDLE